MERYGSGAPAGSKKVQDKMAATNLERYGAKNASSAPEIKDRRKKTMIDKYGVTNPSFIPEVIDTIRNQAKERWGDSRSGKTYTIDGLTRKRYAHRVYQISITTYLNNVDLLDPERKRGKDWHIDHIYSVEDGFLNNVPPNIMGHVSNLRLISSKENYAKHKRSEKSIEELYEDFHRSHT
jgi:hypothetical protein